MMLGSKGILTPLIPNCYVLCTPAILKTFVIRSFFFKKWLLTHVLAGPKFKNPPASKLASDFRPFDPGIKLCDYLQTYEVTTMKYQIKDGTVTLGGMFSF